MMLTPFIDEQFSGQIWKLVIDDANGLLFAELRNEENREVSFAGVDLGNGATNFKHLTLPEKWLSGLSGSFNGILFAHGYRSAQSPTHKGITAIDGATGNILWSDYNNAIDSVSSNGPIAYNTQVQPPKLFLMDALTGKYIRGFDASADLDIVQNITIPDITDHLPDGFEIPQGTLTGNIHYLEYNNFRIVSLHLLNNGSLTQVLLISDEEKLVYNDILNEGIQKLQPEAFILYQNKLIYIKNKTVLRVLNL